jgi:hypothetical protein
MGTVSDRRRAETDSPLLVIFGGTLEVSNDFSCDRDLTLKRIYPFIQP